jgi:hypothetical protein
MLSAALAWTKDRAKSLSGTARCFAEREQSFAGASVGKHRVDLETMNEPQ